MGQNKRNQPGSQVYDGGSIHTMEFNPAAGAQKVLEVGRSLLPLGDGAGGYTTNATTIKILPSAGKNLAVYNNTTTVASVTVSTSASQASLAVGVTDANGNVGIPCAPNAWTYIACNQKNFVIASAATLLVFLIDDETYIRSEFNILPGN